MTMSANASAAAVRDEVTLALADWPPSKAAILEASGLRETHPAMRAACSPRVVSSATALHVPYFEQLGFIECGSCETLPALVDAWSERTLLYGHIECAQGALYERRDFGCILMHERKGRRRFGRNVGLLVLCAICFLCNNRIDNVGDGRGAGRWFQTGVHSNTVWKRANQSTRPIGHGR